MAPGDRCAILAQNDAHWCAAYLAILAVGGVVVPLDTNYSAAQAAAILHDIKSPLQVILTNAHRLEEWSAIAPVLKPLAAGETIRLTEDDRAQLGDFAEEVADLGRETLEAATLMTRVLEQIQPYMKSGAMALEASQADPVAVIRFALSIVVLTIEGD